MEYLGSELYLRRVYRVILTNLDRDFKDSFFKGCVCWTEDKGPEVEEALFVSDYDVLLEIILLFDRAAFT